MLTWEAPTRRSYQAKRQSLRGDPDREAKAWLEKLSEVNDKRAAFQDMAAEGLITFDELRAKLAALEETREVAERELAALKGQQENLQQMERDKDAVLRHYVTLAPEALDSLTPEERRKLYNMLRLRVLAYPDEPAEVEWEWELPNPTVCKTGTMGIRSSRSLRRIRPST
jgi:chromosome segregation ATPase